MDIRHCPIEIFVDTGFPTGVFKAEDDSPLPPPRLNQHNTLTLAG